ncbi:pentapeptide repeat-containing protein [Streptomyces actuosus]|uniref:Pentapeptide repeat-containing protein n=1 Tax=Streptomyces actuosus TaxID=1885 RepID=A0ABS2VJZ8_STRAS|nr:pentapeptide repeat-containing protein [Streptomyces actuosus]MBN0043412.1 pentapeptide repeat-containing protein [Streptomyces actuosus]
MARRLSPLGVGLLVVAAVLLSLAAVLWAPQMVYPPLTDHELIQVSDGEKRIELQQVQSQLQKDLRGQLLQFLGGLVVLAGAVAGWRQLRLAHEGQVTERFTRAIDQLGSNSLDVRIGGLYALERVARNSPSDRPTVTYVLAGFIRQHAPWLVGAADGPRHPSLDVDPRTPWLTNRAPDVQIAAHILGRRPPHAEEAALYLSRVDLRHCRLTRARLAGSNLRHANLARTWMPEVDLRNARLFNADLRQTNMRDARLTYADLRNAHLQHADLRSARLHGADLRGTNLDQARLDGADLTAVRTDESTVWPVT